MGKELTEAPYPGMKPIVGELVGINYWGPIVDILKCMFFVRQTASYKPRPWNGNDGLILGHRKF